MTTTRTPDEIHAELVAVRATWKDLPAPGVGDPAFWSAHVAYYQRLVDLWQEIYVASFDRDTAEWIVCAVGEALGAARRSLAQLQEKAAMHDWTPYAPTEPSYDLIDDMIYESEDAIGERS